MFTFRDELDKLSEDELIDRIILEAREVYPWTTIIIYCAERIKELRKESK